MLHERGMKAKDIAHRVGISVSLVYRWTKELRQQERQARDAEIARLRGQGMSTREIADEVDLDCTTVARALQNSKTGILQHEPESQAEPEMEPPEAETAEEPEAARSAEI